MYNPLNLIAHAPAATFIKARILIVDDEYTIARCREKEFTALGHKVVGIATHPDDARTMVAKHRPDLISMDTRLDTLNMDGIDLAEEILKTHQCAIVFVSAHFDEGTVEKASRINPHGFIIKSMRGNNEYYRLALQNAMVRLDRERELARSNELLNIAIEVVGRSVVALDMDCRIIAANEHVQQVFNKTFEEAKGMKWTDYVNIEPAVDGKEHVITMALKATGATRIPPFRVVTDDGRKLLLEGILSSQSTVLNAEGTPQDGHVFMFNAHTAVDDPLDEIAADGIEAGGKIVTIMLGPDYSPARDHLLGEHGGALADYTTNVIRKIIRRSDSLEILPNAAVITITVKNDHEAQWMVTELRHSIESATLNNLKALPSGIQHAGMSIGYYIGPIYQASDVRRQRAFRAYEVARERDGNQSQVWNDAMEAGVIGGWALTSQLFKGQAVESDAVPLIDAAKDAHNCDDMLERLSVVLLSRDPRLRILVGIRCAGAIDYAKKFSIGQGDELVHVSDADTYLLDLNAAISPQTIGQLLENGYGELPFGGEMYFAIPLMHSGLPCGVIAVDNSASLDSVEALCHAAPAIAKKAIVTSVRDQDSMSLPAVHSERSYKAVYSASIREQCEALRTTKDPVAIVGEVGVGKGYLSSERLGGDSPIVIMGNDRGLAKLVFKKNQYASRGVSSVIIRKAEGLSDSGLGVLKKYIEDGMTAIFKSDVPKSPRCIVEWSVDAAGSPPMPADLAALMVTTTLYLPPLRKMGGRTIRLAETLLAEIGAAFGRPDLKLTESARAAVGAHAWDGNLPHLLQTLKHGVLQASENEISPIALGIEPPRQRSTRKTKAVDLSGVKVNEAHLSTAMLREVLEPVVRLAASSVNNPPPLGNWIEQCIRESALKLAAKEENASGRKSVERTAADIINVDPRTLKRMPSSASTEDKFRKRMTMFGSVEEVLYKVVEQCMFTKQSARQIAQSELLAVVAKMDIARSQGAALLCISLRSYYKMLEVLPEAV